MVGKYIIDMKVIASLYLRSHFFFDVLACLPCLLTKERVHGLYILKLFRLIKIPRLVAHEDRIVKILHDNYMQFQFQIDNVISIFNTAIIFMITAHLASCLWIFIG